MNIWFLIWVFLAVFIMGIFLWSMQILFKQKKGWTEFAKRHQLDCASPAMLKSPVISGVYKTLSIQIYSEEQPTDDQRGRRFRTIIQAELPAAPIEGIVASQRHHGFANNLADLTETFVPEFPGWDTSLLIKTRNSSVLKSYLTDDKLRALQSVLTMKTFSGLYIFDTNAAYLRFETPDPLYDIGKLERACTKIVESAAALKA